MSSNNGDTVDDTFVSDTENTNNTVNTPETKAIAKAKSKAKAKNSDEAEPKAKAKSKSKAKSKAKDSDETEPKAKAKSKSKAKAKAKTKEKESDNEDSNSDSDNDSYKGPANSDISDEEKSDNDDNPPPKAKAKAKAKAKNSDEAEPKPKSKSKAKAKSKETEEGEEEPSSSTSKPKRKSKSNEETNLNYTVNNSNKFFIYDRVVDYSDDTGDRSAIKTIIAKHLEKVKNNKSSLSKTEKLNKTRYQLEMENYAFVYSDSEDVELLEDLLQTPDKKKYNLYYISKSNNMEYTSIKQNNDTELKIDNIKCCLDRFAQITAEQAEMNNRIKTEQKNLLELLDNKINYLKHLHDTHGIDNESKTNVEYLNVLINGADTNTKEIKNYGIVDESDNDGPLKLGSDSD